MGVIFMAEKEGFDLHFCLMQKLWCCHRPAGDKQQSTGLLHLHRFKSLSLSQL